MSAPEMAEEVASTLPARNLALASMVSPTLRVLLVEDDEGDAFLVRELLLDDEADVELIRARSLREAEELVPGSVDCVLLDLGLPDATGMDGLHRLLDLAPSIAVLVLTGLADEHRGTEAVAAGAQDYLVKGAIDGQLLSRAIRYAVERKRADESVRRLYASEVRAAENARLERGLLPQALVSDRVRVVPSYRPGGEQAVLGGDFYDVVECSDGSIFALVGDVAGHGPDEAALGVCLRIAWRTLILAGADPDTIFGSMQDVLVSERPTDEVFATAAMVRIRPEESQARFWIAGHPMPLLVDHGEVCIGPSEATGVALGVLEAAGWRGVDRPVGKLAHLMLYTDGLIEGFADPGTRSRLGDAGLRDVLRGLLDSGLDGAPLLDALMGEVTRRNGGELTDDVAVLMLSWSAW